MLSSLGRVVSRFAFVFTAASLSAAPVINEIHYRPGTTYPENTGLEFIEIHNPDATPVDISGWGITTGADFTFPAGTTLPAGGFIVIGANPTALMGATGLANVFGPWKAGSSLSNRGEDLTLSRPGSAAGSWETVDVVTYAHEGDWSTRTRDSIGGWSWVSGAHDAGRSLERRNPRLAKDNGQNWASSTPVGGTPGVVNSVASSNVAPIISEVNHSPAVPRSTDLVTISCRLDDESAISALTATLHWRNATSTNPGAFQSVTMANLGNGYFSAKLSAMADKTIVEFYVSASDGTQTRVWPAPSEEGQNVNCTYQVDNEVIAGTAPVYRLIMTAAENAAYNSLAQSNPRSDRQFHFTLVATTGAEPVIRYRASMRFRGNSSRNYTIKPLRISLPTDSRWDDVSDFTIGPRGAPWQYLAHKIQRAAGLVAADVSAVEVRRQGVEYTVGTGSAADYGKLVRVEEIDGDYVDNHWPDAVAGQIYRKVTISGWSSGGNPPNNPDSTWSGWSKQNNSGENDWSDVMNFSAVWQAAAAPHFTLGAPGNVSAGNWNGTAFTDAQMASISQVADLDYMARWLAVMAIIPNYEPNLSTGEDDDYAAAFINDGVSTRMILLPHDMDTVFGTGESAFGPTVGGLYDATELGGSGMGMAAQMKPLLPLLGNSTTPGNAAFRAKYLTAIRELYGSIFDSDTSGGNTNPAFFQFVDNHLADWVPAANRTAVKTFMTARQTFLLNLVGAPKIAPAVATSISTQSGAVPSLRINEVLASNTRTFVVGSTYPDVIELYNSGATAVDLADKSLTDTTDTPRRFVFPAGASIPAGGYLTVYADSNTTAPGYHTGFGLDADGDAVYLYDSPANGGVLLDGMAFGLQLPDYSVSRTADDTSAWTLTTPTLGAANGNGAELGAFSGVRINEWAGNIHIRAEEDFIELYNPSPNPVALGSARITDNLHSLPSRYRFNPLSFMAGNSFMVINSDQLDFGLNGNFDMVFLVGENGAVADRVDFGAQPEDSSTGRVTDGGTTWAHFAVPTPGLSNAMSLPPSYAALIANLRVTEVMFRPVAASNAGDYEYVELQNIGSTTLDLSGVRFTEGIEYEFPLGFTLAPGAYVAICKNRTLFLARYPGAAGTLAPGAFTGALDNSGENLSLSLPAPWDTTIVRFGYEATWQTLANTTGHSLVVIAPATTPAREWELSSTWTASESVNGSPGSAGGLTITGAASAGGEAGRATSLSIPAVTGATGYQWQFLVNGQWVNIPGATSATYLNASTQLAHNGSYRVVVTTATASLTSDPVTVSVTTPATANTGRVLNLSTRAMTQTGNNVLIPGFVITGTGTKRVLLRAVGPSLAAFQLPGFLPDPQFVLKRFENPNFVDIATADNWSSLPNASEIMNVSAASGAFALVNPSLDASLVLDLVPGQYSALVTGVNNTTGVSLAEVYDADASTTSALLGNIATRGIMGAGGDVMIAGFVISEGSRTVLLRAVGPTLANFQVAGFVADPQLALYGRPNGLSTDQVLVTSDNWSDESGAANTVAVSAQVGAFALPNGSKDAALVVTLPPGSYTVHATGAGGTTGVGLIEVYIVP